MHSIQASAPSFLAGAALCALCVLAMSQKPAAPTVWEYKVVTSPSEDHIGSLTEEAWEYVGYLGQSKRGPSLDETLWRRPAR